MDPLYSAFVGAIVRWAVTLVIGFLVAHHIIAVDQSAYFTEGFSHKLLLASPMLAPLAWSLWAKYKGRVRFLTALEAPAGTSEASVNAKIENGMGASVKTDDSLINSIARSVPIVMIAGLLGLAAFTWPGCGPKQYHTAVVANTAIAQAIFAVQDAETAAHDAKLIADADHQKYKAEILKLLLAGDELTLALKDWNPNQPVPANVGQAIVRVSALLTDLQVMSPQAGALIATVETVLSVLRGSGVLPADVVLIGECQPERLKARVPLLDGHREGAHRFAEAVHTNGRLSHQFPNLCGGRLARSSSEPAAERRREDEEQRGDRDFNHALILLPEVARG